MTVIKVVNNIYRLGNDIGLGARGKMGGKLCEWYIPSTIRPSLHTSPKKAVQYHTYVLQTLKEQFRKIFDLNFSVSDSLVPNKKVTFWEIFDIII